MSVLRVCSLLAAVGSLFVGVLCAQAPTPPVATPQPGVSFGIGRPTSRAPQPLPKANAQGASLLQQSLAAVGAESPATDVTLTGNITVFIPGGSTDTGTIVMVARGDAQAEVTMKMATGTRSEVRTISPDGVAAEMRTGPDGTVAHNRVRSLLSPHPAWFFPQFVMGSQPQSGLASSFIGPETRAGVAVNHVQVWQLPSSSSLYSSVPPGIVHTETQYELYLDPATSLPVAMVYYVQPDYPKSPRVVNVHRDTRAQVEMRFSNYQRVEGIPVAYHIQAFIQGRQIYDIQLSSATFNTGPVIPTVN
jgi:hypothetical protein